MAEISLRALRIAASPNAGHPALRCPAGGFAGAGQARNICWWQVLAIRFHKWESNPPRPISRAQSIGIAKMISCHIGRDAGFDTGLRERPVTATFRLPSLAATSRKLQKSLRGESSLPAPTCEFLASGHRQREAFQTVVVKFGSPYSPRQAFALLRRCGRIGDCEAVRGALAVFCVCRT